MKRSGRSRSSARVVWDEANLDYLEATKSPKRKITEPKTPYHAPENEDGMMSPFPNEDMASLDNAAHAEAIYSALTEVASTSSGERSRGGGWTSSEDEADEMDQDYKGGEANGHRVSFVEQRKAHYDEYRTVKLLQQQDSKLNDADEEDENRFKTCTSGDEAEFSLAGGMGAIGLEEGSSLESSYRNGGKQHKWQ